MATPTYRGFEIGHTRREYVALKGGVIVLRARTEQQIYDLIDQRTRKPLRAA